mmetsp:Transcript_95806/g.248103  ORF Transcript_95806/g.248103 Transcript_95806/m.248103 type:complete len:219 (+) Transcript_95806:1782-2438(+)
MCLSMTACVGSGVGSIFSLGLGAWLGTSLASRLDGALAGAGSGPSCACVTISTRKSLSAWDCSFSTGSSNSDCVWPRPIGLLPACEGEALSAALGLPTSGKKSTPGVPISSSAFVGEACDGSFVPTIDSPAGDAGEAAPPPGEAREAREATEAGDMNPWEAGEAPPSVGGPPTLGTEGPSSSSWPSASAGVASSSSQGRSSCIAGCGCSANGCSPRHC